MRATGDLPLIGAGTPSGAETLVDDTTALRPAAEAGTDGTEQDEWDQ